MINQISFPGLGIPPFSINSVAFTLFGKDIAWYGIIITTGIVLAFFYVLSRAKIEKVKSDDILDLALFCVLSAMIGARAYYVLTNLDYYKTFWDIIAVWNGGLAIYGAIIAGGIAAFFVAKYKKIKFTKIFDMLAPGVLLGQVIGRWGNFMNAEAFGYETTLPWRMGIQSEYATVPIYVHPTFLYESLWNLVGFILIHAFYKKKKYDGQVFLFYIAWYGFGRMLIEGLRTDSLYVGNFRISQVVGFGCFVIGSILLLIFGIKARTAKKDKESTYTEVFTEEKKGEDEEDGNTH